MYEAPFEQLTSFATGPEFAGAVLDARRAWFAGHGEVFEDDRSFDARMAAFFDYFVFEFPTPPHGRTPARLFLERHGDRFGAEERLAVEGFVRTHRSLFEVRGLAEGRVRVRDLFHGGLLEVVERRLWAGVQRGDLVEARVIPVGGQLAFAKGFCFHPREARRVVLAQLARLQSAPTAEFSREGWMATLGRMALKVERYRNIRVTDIYAFDRKTI